MPIRRSSIPSGSWETTLSQTPVKQSLGMAGGSVSIAISSPHCQMEETTKLAYRPGHFFVGPGLHIAQVYLWIASAMSLAVFDIEKYVDESGNVVEPETRYTNGGIR